MLDFLKRPVLAAFAALALFAMPFAAFAQTTDLDQVPAAVPSTGNATGTNSECMIQHLTVPGGAVYWQLCKAPGPNGTMQPGGFAFVPGGGGAITRYMSLIDGHTSVGVPLTATAGTPAGAVGVSRTPGTSLTLVGEATSASAKTNKVMWEVNVPSTYVPGASIPVVINANYTGAGTITGASTTLTVLAWSEGQNGAETALTVSAAQPFTGTAANYTFTITGTGLVVGQRLALEVDMLVTSSSGANTGQINSVAMQM